MATKTDEQEQTAIDYLEHAVEDLKQAGQEAEDSGISPTGMEKVEQRADRRRLARAVWPEEAEDLALLDGHRHVLDAAMAAVELAQPIGLNGWYQSMLGFQPETRRIERCTASRSGFSRGSSNIWNSMLFIT